MALLERGVKRSVSLNEGTRNSSLGLEVENMANTIFFLWNNPVIPGFFKTRTLPSSKNPHFQMRPSVQPFLWKWVLFAWEWKIISKSKAEHWRKKSFPFSIWYISKSLKIDHAPTDIRQGHPTTECFQIPQNYLKWFSLCFISLFNLVNLSLLWIIFICSDVLEELWYSRKF